MPRGKTREECLKMGEKTKLKKNDPRTKAIAAKSLEKRLENKQGREAALAVLRLPLTKAEQINLQAEYGISEHLTQENAADIAMLREAKGGNTTAYDKLMKKAGLMVDKSESLERVEVEWKDDIKTKEDAKRFLQKLNKGAE